MMAHSRTYHRLTAAVILLFVIAGILTVGDYGMGWDEVTRWKSGDLKLLYYQKLVDGSASDLEERMAGDRYPGFFDLPLATFHSTFGGNRMVQGHLLSIAFGALGLAATAWLAFLVFNARVAFFSTLFLAVLPHFYGHAMINPKDIPFMATYTLGLATVVRVSQRLVLHGTIKWSRFLLCGLAIGLAGATRVPGLVLLAMAGAAWTAASLFGAWKHKHSIHPVRTPLFLARGLLLTGVMAFVTVLLFFPRAQFQIFSSLPDVASSLHSSAAEIPLLFAGQVSDSGDGPFAYAHAFFLVSTPLWMILLLAAGLGLLIRHLAKGPEGLMIHFFIQCLFLAVAAFPWVYILLTQPALHNGIRHMLFGIPPLVILMAYAADYMVDIVRVRSRLVEGAAAGLLAGCILLQIVNLVQMHPYQYVAFNKLAGPRATIPNRYEAEYWFTSSRHLLEALPAVTGRGGLGIHKGQSVKVRIAGPLQAARPFLPGGFDLVDSIGEADYFLSNTTFRTDLLAEGEVIHEIERGGMVIGVIKDVRGAGTQPAEP
jgi:hypothetical protein